MSSGHRTILGSAGHPGYIDPGTMTRHRSRSRTITGAPRQAPLPTRLDALIFDGEFLIRFLGSVAHAKVLEKNTKVAWVEYRDSSVLNGIYAVMGVFGFGAPGTAQVDPGDIDKINAEKEAEEARLYEAFVDALLRGPPRVLRFLNAQDEIRARALDFVQDVYRDVDKINRGVAHEAQRGVARLSLVKCASTLAVKTIALRAGGMPAFLIGSAYDISLNIVDNWSQGESAVAVGVASKSVDKLWKKAAKDTAKNMANIYKNEASGPAAKAEWLARRLEEIDDKLNARGIAERSAKYAKDARRLDRARQAAASAQRGAAAMTAVKYGFFAWDVYKTLDRADSDLKAAGYESAWAGVSDAFSTGD